jgi:two-component system sensor histidine kinase/response regulator
MSKKVLVVDDDAAMRWMLAKEVGSLGYQIDSACNGLEALKYLQQNNYELILMDIRMPIMDGYTATKAIRKIESEQGISPVPIVVLSSEPEPARCKEAGVTDFFVKPMFFGQLNSVLSKWLKPQHA